MDMPIREMGRVYVIVTGEWSDDEDNGVEGIYAMGVNQELSSGQRCEAVLDQFHGHIGISVLDDFDIVVVDPAGQALDRLDDYENGSLENEADFWGSIGAEDAPDAVAAIFASRTTAAKP
jgi:hypothetical protein